MIIFKTIYFETTSDDKSTCEMYCEDRGYVFLSMYQTSTHCYLTIKIDTGNADVILREQELTLLATYDDLTEKEKMFNIYKLFGKI